MTPDVGLYPPPVHELPAGHPRFDSGLSAASASVSAIPSPRSLDNRSLVAGQRCQEFCCQLNSDISSVSAAIPSRPARPAMSMQYAA